MLKEAQLVGVGLMTVVIHACITNIRNISYPFRLKGDPPSCSYPEYGLFYENNRTVINLHGGKYLVTQINYHNYTIRVVDPGRKKDNFLISSPLHSIGAYYTEFEYDFPYYLPYQWIGDNVSVGDIPHSCTIGTSMRIQLLKALLEPKLGNPCNTSMIGGWILHIIGKPPKFQLLIFCKNNIVKS
ncbi:hypothetical protein AAG906_038624 [Vitis piasezkii]